MIRRRNIDTGSLVRGPVGPFRVRLPRTDFAGVSNTTPAALGDKLVMNGSYCRNISTDTFSCDLRIPTQLVVTSVANADQWQFAVGGRDHLGREVQEVIVKAAINRQTEGASRYCYSHIDYIKVLSATTVTNNVRVGFCYGTWLLENTQLTRRIAASGIGVNRRIPLPFIPRYTTDCGVIFVGSNPDFTTLITSNPTSNVNVAGVSTQNGKVTFSGSDNVTATYSGDTLTWDVSGVAANDIAVTYDGFTGIVASTAANAITVVKWYKNGVGGTGTNVPTTFLYSLSTTERDGFPVIQVFRPTCTTAYTPTTGGLLPNQPMPGLAGTAGTYNGVTQSTSAGVDLTAANFGTIFDIIHEPFVDTEFDVYLTAGAAY